MTPLLGRTGHATLGTGYLLTVRSMVHGTRRQNIRFCARAVSGGTGRVVALDACLPAKIEQQTGEGQRVVADAIWLRFKAHSYFAPLHPPPTNHKLHMWGGI